MAGLSDRQAEEVGTSMLSVPAVTLSDVGCGLDGEDGEVMEGDIVTCSARVTLSRPSHSLTGPPFALAWPVAHVSGSVHGELPSHTCCCC